MFNTELEKAILYFVIFEKYECNLYDLDFFDPINKEIFNAIETLKKNKQEISVLSVANLITDIPNILEYLSNLGNKVVGANPDIIYASIIELSARRIITKNLQTNTHKLLTSNVEETPTEAVISDISEVFKRVENRTIKDEKIEDDLVDTINELQENWKNKDDFSFYYGIDGLDKLTLGLHKQELTIIGARPGVGKTTFALQLAEKLSQKQKKVCFISLEMSKTQILEKVISSKTLIPTYKMKMGTLQSDDWEKIMQASNEISGSTLKIVSKAIDLNQIESYARKLKAREDLDCLIIDYIQLVTIKNKKYENRTQEVTEISRNLKLLSLELNIPIIALCQLNRNASRQEPTLADLRESGSLEQDADNVIFLYKEDSEDNSINCDEIIKVAKQRTGETGNVPVTFAKAKGTFITRNF